MHGQANKKKNFYKLLKKGVVAYFKTMTFVLL